MNQLFKTYGHLVVQYKLVPANDKAAKKFRGKKTVTKNGKEYFQIFNAEASSLSPIIK